MIMYDNLFGFFIFKDDKFKFLSKGKIKSKEQIYDENINNILYDNKKYVAQRNDADMYPNAITIYSAVLIKN